MTVYLVGAGPGDPGLLTQRGAELLAQADVVVYDRLIDRSLLGLAPRGALLIDGGKNPTPVGRSDAQGASLSREMSRQDEINSLLVEHGRAGLTVVRLKGGDPFLFGRGGEEVEALREAKIPWVVVPGVTSAMAVPAAAGIAVTHRGLSSSVTVVTGHVGEDTAPGGVDWESLARAGGTLVILMGMANRNEIARRLQMAGRPADTPAAVVEWGTTSSQRVARTTLEQLGSVELGSPAVIVVGPVASLDLLCSEQRPLAGRSVVVTRAAGQASELSGALRAAGAVVVEMPVIEILDPPDGGVALADAAKRIRDFDWVAFTSTNAVHSFVTLIPDGRSFSAVRLAAVGEATASALRQYRLVPDLIPERSTSDGLADAFSTAPGPNARVLFPKAELAGPGLAEGLRAKGWAVEEVVAYRTVVAPPPGVPLADAVASADVVTFTSPSTVSSYLGLNDAAGRSLVVPPVVACIGPTTAQAARDAGLKVDVVASSPSMREVVEELSEHFRSASAMSGRVVG